MSFKASSYSLKAPPDLDFYTFLHVVDNTTGNGLLGQLLIAQANLYLYSSKDQITIAYSLTDALNQLIEENQHDYHTRED